MPDPCLTALWTDQRSPRVLATASAGFLGDLAEMDGRSSTWFRVDGPRPRHRAFTDPETAADRFEAQGITHFPGQDHAFILSLRDGDATDESWFECRSRFDITPTDGLPGQATLNIARRVDSNAALEILERLVRWFDPLVAGLTTMTGRWGLLSGSESSPLLYIADRHADGRAVDARLKLERAAGSGKLYRDPGYMWEHE